MSKDKNKNGLPGGVVTRSYLDSKNNVVMSYQNEKIHNLIIGTTGSGKTQTIIIPSILSIANSNASMVINDPKGELYSLTCEYLKKLGYKVYMMDYLSPISGGCFNQLFLVEQEYRKGLPHLYATKAIDVLLKMLDTITSGGEIMEFKAPQIEYYPTQIVKTPNILKTAVLEDPFSKNKKKYVALEIGKLKKIENENLKKLANLNDKEIVNFMHDILSYTYEAIDIDYNSKKPNNLLDDLFENVYLKEKQEKVVQAAIDILNIASAENFELYYKAKIKQLQLVINNPDADSSSETYKYSTNLIEKYKIQLEEVKKEGFTVDTFREFLIDSKVDHSIVWDECETQAVSLAGSIATTLMEPTGGSSGDKFWVQTATSLTKSLILFVCRESHLNYSKHLGSVNRILSSLTTMDKNDKTEIDKIFEAMLDGDRAKLAQAEMRVASDKTKSSILASAIAPLSIFANYDVVDQASRLDFNPENLVNEKAAVFLIAPGEDDKGTAQFTTLNTLFIEQTYSCLNRMLNNTAELTLPRPVYFLIDELCNIPPISALGPKITLARSKNIRFTLVVQSYAQLAQHYKNSADTIRENAYQYYLLSNDVKTAEELSKRLGKQTIQQYSSSTSDNKHGSSTSTSVSQMGRDLMTPQELMILPSGEGIYMMSDELAYRTKLLHAYKMPIYKWLEANKIQNVHYRRQPQEVNYFAPDPNLFIMAYKLFHNDCCIDKYIYNIFSSTE